MATLTANLLFVKPGSWPDTEKPYSLLYQPDDDLKLTNFEISDLRPVDIYDMRPKKDTLSIDREGFMFTDFKSKLNYEDYFDDEKLKSVFAPEVRDLLVGKLGAKAAFIHECVVQSQKI